MINILLTLKIINLQIERSFSILISKKIFRRLQTTIEKKIHTKGMILVLFIFCLILSIILRTLMVAKWLQAAGNLNQQIPKGGIL